MTRAPAEGPRSNLAVLVDGVPLPEDEARTLWQRFSDWMEEHRGDLAGFAAREGFASVHPSVDKGKPVLLASKTAPQRPYGPVTPGAKSSGGGSGDRHDRPRRDRSRRGKPRN
jgi:hypothetical protein